MCLTEKEGRKCFLTMPSTILFMVLTDRIAHTTAFVTPVVERWLECEIAQWVHHDESI